MDTPPPTDPPSGSPQPPEPPLVLPAADLPPLDPSTGDEIPVLEPAAEPPVLLPVGPPPKPPVDRRTLLFLGVLGFGAVIYVLLLIAGGPGRQFALEGLQVLPFLGLSLLAYAGERNDTFRMLAVVYWGLLAVVAVLFIALFTAMAGLDLAAFAKLQTASKTGARPPANPAALFLPGGPLHFALTTALCFLAALVGAAAYASGVRRAAARVLPGFDANSFVHAVALATVTALTLTMFVPLLVTGEPPLLTFIRHLTTADMGDGGRDLTDLFGDQSMLVEQVYAFMWMVPMGLLVVGWPLHRTLPAALRRVGFVVPSIWQVLLGLWLAVVMAVVMGAGVDVGIARLWEWMHWPRTDETALEQLFKAVTSPVGAVVIGVTAGVGEELLVRGILQPRLGILLSNLFFTSLHAVQYNWDALLSVFLIGMVLGLVRKKTNTTTSAIVHGTYDFLLVLASYYQIDPSKWFGW